MTNKQDTFTRGVKQVKRAMGGGRQWRTLYRTMHTIRDQFDSYGNEWEQVKYETRADRDRAAAIITTVSVAFDPKNNRRVKKLAENLGDIIFDAIIRNGDADIDIKWARMNIQARYKFFERTIMTAHYMYNIKHGIDTRVLIDVKFEKTGDSPTSKGAYIRYGLVLVYTAGLNQSFAGAISTLAHEYTHALQHAHATTLPDYLEVFINKNWAAYQDVEYEHRPDEKEAFAVGNALRQSIPSRLAANRRKKSDRD